MRSILIVATTILCATTLTACGTPPSGTANPIDNTSTSDLNHTSAAKQPTSSNPFVGLPSSWLTRINLSVPPVERDWAILSSDEIAWANGSLKVNPISEIMQLKMDVQNAMSNLADPPASAKTATGKLVSVLQSIETEDNNLDHDILEPHPGVPLSKSAAGKHIHADMKALLLNMGILSKDSILISVAMQKTSTGS